MNKRLLVIDDEKAICDLVSLAAEQFGLEVTAIQDARGVDPAFISEYDVLLLDLLMPHIDGIEVLRLHAAAKRKPKLILMSGLERRTLESARQLAETKGIPVFAVLQKPFRPAALIALFEKHCGAAEAVEVTRNVRGVPVLTLDEVSQALELDQLVVHFQPQVVLADGSWGGVEALVRWQHPVHGLIFPDSFMPLVEQSALSLPLTEVVIRKAIQGVNILSREAGFSGTLSVNIPAAALTDMSFPEKLVAVLDELAFERARFILEVTETSIPKSVEVSLDIETRLRMRGIALSIDDFGTGHSSLERLHDAPFSELKIDLVFVRRVDHDQAARAIVENAIKLGRSLDMTVVAEGVETESILHWLKEAGCDIAQGYFLSRPLSVDALIDWARAKGGVFIPASSKVDDAPKDHSVPILLVEDNLHNQELYRQYLGELGHEVVIADNGEAALDLIARHRYKLVLMDTRLPKMDGVEVTRRVRTLPGSSGSIPIIAMLDSSGGSDQQRFQDAGANDSLIKPVRLKAMRQVVDHLLAQSPASA